MKDLKVLNLSIPTLDSSECKTLMGGDGYGDDIWGGEISGVEVIGEKTKPECPDYDRDDDYLDYGDDYDYDNNQDGNQDRDKDGFDLKNMLENAQPQVGNNCVFAAIYAMLCGYGHVSNLGWFSVAFSYASSNGINPDSILNGSFDGILLENMQGLLEQFFNGVSPVDKDGLSQALKDGPVYGVMNPGDTDKDGKENDGHAVIITGYDEDHGTVYYWDPETGESGNGAVGDYIQGWSVNGVKK